MLHTYIVNKEKIGLYFPETNHLEEESDKNTVIENLVCIHSNKWVDIPKKDRYVPLVFKTYDKIDDDRRLLMVKYIEKITDTVGIDFLTVERLGSCYTEYRVFVGDSVLYVSEDDHDNIREKISVFEKGCSFIGDSEGKAKNTKDSKDLDGIWYTKGEVKNDYITEKPEQVSLILGLDPKDGILYDLSHQTIQNIMEIENKNLPKMRSEKGNWIKLVKNLVSKQHPVHTPVKILENINQGNFCVPKYTDFLDDLEGTYSKNTTTILTDRPVGIIYTLLSNYIPYIMTKNGDIFEIIMENKDKKISMMGEEDLHQNIRESCKNIEEVENLDPVQKLDIVIDEGYALHMDKDNIQFSNKHTGKVLPFDMVHVFGSYKHGIRVPTVTYNPHEKVNIEEPIKIDIHSLDDSHVFVIISTEKEKFTVSEEFPFEGGDVKKEIFRNGLRKMWEKGYFLSDYGIVRAVDHGNYEDGCIQKPWWFKSCSPDQTTDLIKFISQI